MIKNSNGYNLYFRMFLKCFYQDYVVNRQGEELKSILKAVGIKRIATSREAEGSIDKHVGGCQGSLRVDAEIDSLTATKGTESTGRTGIGIFGERTPHPPSRPFESESWGVSGL